MTTKSSAGLDEWMPSPSVMVEDEARLGTTAGAGRLGWRGRGAGEQAQRGGAVQHRGAGEAVVGLGGGSSGRRWSGSNKHRGAREAVGALMARLRGVGDRMAPPPIGHDLAP